MKKVLLFAAAGLVLFASCRKNRNCKCTDQYGYEYVDTYIYKTKSQAQTLCDAEEVNGYTCELMD